jgi:LuxR family transcriptional regulator, maltose regulon positive regulatory protein
MNRITLTTKFFTPLLRKDYVARPRLLRKFGENFQQSLILISAPAGFGKTTLLSEWVSANKNLRAPSFAWLSLDNKDNAPNRFWCFVIQALQIVKPGLGKAALKKLISSDPAPLEPILIVLLNEIAQLDQQLTLILDDYHVIESLEIHQAMIFLIEHLPATLQLILATRIDPPWPLARWRTQQWFLELRRSDLRFNFEEAAAFLNQSMKLGLNPNDVVNLENRTEGWIAGLQMAALSLQDHDDPSGFIQSFAGNHRYILDYLLEEVLDRQPPDIRDFLLKTSILKRLSSSLCNAVMAITNSQTVLEALDQKNLFLIPLDEHRQWYRYHHLFADLLNIMLEQAHPGLAASLHRRASDWFSTHEMILEALDHALSAGDMELAARLVSTNVLALVEHAELAPILRQVDNTPLEQRKAQPWLGVAHAWALAYSGQVDRANTALTLVEERLQSLPLAARDQIIGHIAAVRAYAAWVQGSQKQAVELAEQAAVLLLPNETAVRALNLTTLGNALDQYAASQRSVEALEQAVELARQVEQSHVFMPAASGLAYAYFGLGRMHKAHEICLEAIELAEAHQRRTGRQIYAAASVYAELAATLVEWGECKPALQAARQGVALAERWAQADTILLCLLNQVKALSCAQEFKAAEQVLVRARKLARTVSPWFVASVDLIEIGFWLDMGDSHQATRVAHNAVGNLPVWMEAWLLLAQNRLDQALSLLEKAISGSLADTTLETVRLGVLQSLGLFLLQDEKKALAALGWTLEMAAPENLVFTFVRMGESMEMLLRRALAKSLCPAFTRQLIASFGARGKPRSLMAAEGLFEPLSTRELEILALLDGPLSTPEIAEQLVISTYTVRAHIKNIYSKLGVHGRSAAVMKAKEFGLLA